MNANKKMSTLEIKALLKSKRLTLKEVSIMWSRSEGWMSKLINNPNRPAYWDCAFLGLKSKKEIKGLKMDTPQILSIVNADDNKLTYIIGKSGSGKSHLATALHEKISNSVLIDAGEHSQYQAGTLDITHTLTSTKTIYIIDGIHYLNSCSITALTNHIKKRGRILVFMNSKLDAQLINNEMVDSIIFIE